MECEPSITERRILSKEWPWLFTCLNGNIHRPPVTVLQPMLSMLRYGSVPGGAGAGWYPVGQVPGGPGESRGTPGPPGNADASPIAGPEERQPPWDHSHWPLHQDGSWPAGLPRTHSAQEDASCCPHDTAAQNGKKASARQIRVFIILKHNFIIPIKARLSDMINLLLKLS